MSNFTHMYAFYIESYFTFWLLNFQTAEFCYFISYYKIFVKYSVDYIITKIFSNDL